MIDELIDGQQSTLTMQELKQVLLKEINKQQSIIENLSDEELSAIGGGAPGFAISGPADKVLGIAEHFKKNSQIYSYAAAAGIVGGVAGIIAGQR